MRGSTVCKKKRLPDLPGYPAEDLEMLCDAKTLIRTHVRRLGRFIAYFSDQLDDVKGPDPDVFRDWIVRVEGNTQNLETAYNYLSMVGRTFRALYGETPFLRALDAGIQAFHHEVRPKKHKADHQPKKLTFSLPIDALPHDWQEAVADMEAGVDGIGRPAPASSILKSQIRKICELAKVAVDNDRAIDLTIESAKLYERSLVQRERSLSPTTIKSSIRHLRDFAQYTGAPAPVIAHLQARTRFHESRAAKAMPLKERKIMKIPTYTEIFEHAFDLLGRAEKTTRKRTAQRYRNFAAALTLMCPFPLRVADTCLRFGVNVIWTGEGYQLFIPATSKTGEPFQARIAPFFSIFIDQLILQGSNNEYLDDLRDRATRQRRPLFEGHGSEAVFEGYVSYAWRETYGTGNHITRTKIHDELAIYGLKGVEGALRACGHRSERSAEHYRTRAFTLLAGDHVRSTAEKNISEDEWGRYFDDLIEEGEN